jgi:predicted nuclease of predicted toxin-antitoxin system
VTLWLDAQLSPALAIWFRRTCDVSCFAVRELGLRDASDHDIYMAARDAKAVIVTKDSDFLRLLDKHGPPPQVLWLTCGNTSNQRLIQNLGGCWPAIRALLSSGERLVEVGDQLAR